MTRENEDDSCMDFLNKSFRDNSRFLNRYYDNVGKYSSHFTSSTSSLWLGDARGCSAINASRFCILDMVMEISSMQKSLKWGLCLPPSCSDEIVRNNSKTIFDSFTDSLYKDLGEVMDLSKVENVSCMEKMGPSKGYYVVLSFLALVLLWCIISSLVVLRYKNRSRMRYSFVYRSGPRSRGVVEPQSEVPPRESLSAVPESEGHNNLAVGEDVDGDPGPSREFRSDIAVSDEVFRNDGQHEEGRQRLVEEGGVRNVRRLGKRRKVSEPSTSLSREERMGGATSPETSPRIGDVDDDDDTQSTFAPPSHELLRSAFRYRPGFWTEICHIFSLENNLSNLAKERPNHVIGLDCLRVLSFWLLLLVQVYLFAMKFGLVDKASLDKKRIRGLAMTHVIACHPIALDTLFFVSGFASITNYKKRKWNSLVYIVRRYLRLFVPLAFVILIATFLLPYWTSYSAPQSFRFERLSGQCSEHWWKAVLGIQNFMVLWKAENMDGCLQWTWVVDSQWQQSIFLSLVFFCILNKVVIFFHIFLLVACLSSVASLIDILPVDPNVIGYIGCQEASTQFDSFMNNILTKPYTFVASYVVGVIASYKLFLDKSRPTCVVTCNETYATSRIYVAICRRFNKKTCFCLGWFFCLLVMVGFFAHNCAVLFGEPFSIAGKVFSGTSFHLLWSLVLYWIMYACHRGNGGFLTWFSSWKLWMYAGRLTYSAYLVHGLSLMYICSSWTSVIQPEDYFSVMIIFSSTLVLSYSSSLVVHLLIEAPLLKILGQNPNKE